MQEFDPILLEVLWNRLISIVNEQATALMNASFTTVVREAGDLSAGVFDTEGNMLAQAVTGTPGHINTMATAVRHFLKAYPIDTLSPGDSLVTNNPWLTSGHLHDLTVVTPIFYQGEPIGLFANTCHAMDIGGRTLGADAREVYEEGLSIPIMKLYDRGQPNKDLFAIIRENVRVPEPVIGDIIAQVAGNEVGGKKLVEFMEEYKFTSLASLSKAILDKSEEAMRQAIDAIPDGTYHHQIMVDGFDEPIRIQIALTVAGNEMLIDYAGTSPQCDYGINVVLNYTHAYTTYPVKCAVSPHVPNNEGSFRPVKVMAPAGCILNAQYPAAVGARHIIGHFLSCAVFGALAQVIPDRVIADGSAGLWNTQVHGEDTHGEQFVYVYFSAGGMGARPTSDGLSATAFPSGIHGVPAEIIENVSPLVMLRRELIQDSGGAGKFRGGCGQRMTLRVRSQKPIVHSCMYDRLQFPALGFRGGKAGRKGDLFLSDGTRPHPKKKYLLMPGQEVTLELPGGGGFYTPTERDIEHVVEDVRNGLVSVAAAEQEYGVVLDPATLTVDMEQTQKRRREMV